MKRNTIISAGIAVAVVAAGAIVLLRWVRGVYAYEAVHVIALEVGDLLQRNPSATQAEVQKHIYDLHRASVVNLTLDENGQAVDPFGTSFRVEFGLNRAVATIRVTSAGPDEIFDSEDDITFRHLRNYESKAIHPNQ